MSFRGTFEHFSIQSLVISATNIILLDIFNRSREVFDKVADSNASILGAINANTGVVEAAVNKAITAASESINANILDVNQAIGLAEGNILSEVAGNTTILDGIFGALSKGINVEILNEITLSEGLFGNILSGIQSILKGNTDSIDDLLGKVFSTVLGPILGNLDGILDKFVGLGSIWEAIRVIMQRDSVGEAKERAVIVDPDIEGFGSVVAQSVIEGLTKRIGVSGSELSEATKIVDLDQFLNSYEMTCKQLLAGFLDPTTEGASWIIGVLADIMSAFGFLFVQSKADLERCLAVWSADNPWKVLEPGDVARMWHLGLLENDQAIKVLTMNGYGLGDAADLLNSSQTLPTVDFLMAMWLREIITEPAFDFGLSQQGFNEEYAKGIKELAFFIPPVQDLITMSVREVFTPSIRAENRQDENFPPDFAKWAAQQGVSEFWAKNYWAAHWQLPSVQMGFQMLHRQEIDEDKLRNLMQALDIMPGWVDPLIAISFTPITRVDIRRLNRLELLEGPALRKAYRDIGYNVENAELLSTFTEELNKEDEILTLDVASDLTRSNIIGFYKDGIISKTVASVLLIQAGINVAAAALFIQAADFDIERKDRKQQVDIVFDRFKFGAITFVEANDQISGLGLETAEAQLARLDLVRLREQQTKLPSRADLDKFVKGNIISDAEYLNVMERHGYSDLWAGRYLEAANA